MQQHGIAVGKEPVLLVNRMPIGRENSVLAGEGRNQNQQGAFRKMEIGDQGIDAVDTVARENEDLGIAGKRFDRSIDNRRFQRTQHRGPDRDDTAATGFGSGNLCAQISTHIQPFTVHDMVFQMFRTHGLEGAGAHMQSNVAELYVFGLQLRQDLLVEMQTRRRRRHRAGMAGELGPEYFETVVGRAEIKDVFPAGKHGKAAGILVVDGFIRKALRARITEELVRRGVGIVANSGRAAATRRFSCLKMFWQRSVQLEQM